MAAYWMYTQTIIIIKSQIYCIDAICYLHYFLFFGHTCFCCKNRDLGMEVNLFRSIMTVYSKLYSITLCLHRTELFESCARGADTELHFTVFLTFILC